MINITTIIYLIRLITAINCIIAIEINVLFISMIIANTIFKIEK